ncbi:hypothetical protein FISHEDRAFT_22154, partial [Fistulina hepatica ATCC 64428]
YCDTTYRYGWGRGETDTFLHCILSLGARHVARWFVIRTCIITEGGVEQLFVAGDQLPKF